MIAIFKDVLTQQSRIVARYKLKMARLPKNRYERYKYFIEEIKEKGGIYGD